MINNYTSYAYSDINNNVGYNGDYNLNSLYLMGNGYRLYNPKLRIFYSPDTLAPSNQAGLNPYTFVNGDPINYSDPTGHIAIKYTSKFINNLSLLNHRHQTKTSHTKHISLSIRHYNPQYLQDQQGNKLYPLSKIVQDRINPMQKKEYAPYLYHINNIRGFTGNFDNKATFYFQQDNLYLDKIQQFLIGRLTQYYPSDIQNIGRHQIELASKYESKHLAINNQLVFAEFVNDKLVHTSRNKFMPLLRPQLSQIQIQTIQNALNKYPYIKSRYINNSIYEDQSNISK